MRPLHSFLGYLKVTWGSKTSKTTVAVDAAQCQVLKNSGSIETSKLTVATFNVAFSAREEGQLETCRRGAGMSFIHWGRVRKRANY